MWTCLNEKCEKFDQELETTNFVTTGEYVGAGSTEMGGRQLSGKKWKMSKRTCPLCGGDVRQISGGILRQAVGA